MKRILGSFRRFVKIAFPTIFYDNFLFKPVLWFSAIPCNVSEKEHLSHNYNYLHTNFYSQTKLHIFITFRFLLRMVFFE